MTRLLDQLTAALADRYRIEREIGAGGMATVYQAEDLKHKRQVAIKVLRWEVAASLGPDRFMREIEIAARLQHPNILPVHDSGEVEGLLYYVMPYVEGISLRERLSRQGELPIPDALRILTELVEALAYAHGHGVVHRDLKPDNVMLSGRHPLIMDFGIAKAVSLAAVPPSLTSAGVVLGTPAYMAPEQAAADPLVDHRADLYAVGVIGYELLTGQPPFADVLAAQVTAFPTPISTLRPAVPAVLEALLMQCLQKRPADRPQSADEILQVLERLRATSAGGTSTAARQIAAPLGTGRQRPLMLGVGLLTVAAVAILMWQGRSAPSGVAEGYHTQLTYTGTVARPEISPDGQLLAYVERQRGEGDTSRVVVQDLAGGAVLPITSSWEPNLIWRTLRWTPDGRALLVVDVHGVFAALFPRLGGTRRVVPGVGPIAAFSPEGAKVASTSYEAESPLRITTMATNLTSDISIPDSLGEHIAIDWSPAGRWIAVLTGDTFGHHWILASVEVATGTWRVLLSDTVSLSSPRWSPSGEALYYLRRNDELWRLPVGANGHPAGAPVLLQRDFGASRFQGISLTADGKKLVYGRAHGTENFWLATRSHGQRLFRTAQLTRGTSEKGQATLSPNGRLVAFVQFEQGRGFVGDVFVVPIEGGSPRRLTTTGLVSGRPVWSPDGEQVAVRAFVRGVTKVHTVRLDGRAERTYERTEPSSFPEALAWAPQERILYLRRGDRTFHWLDPTTETEAPLVAADSGGSMGYPAPSPDGRYIAILWSRSADAAGIGLISLRDGAPATLLPGTRDALTVPAWSRDGQFVYFQSGERIHRAPVSGGKGIVVATIPFRNGHCDVTERASDLLLLCNVGEGGTSDAWMIENFDPTPSTVRRR